MSDPRAQKRRQAAEERRRRRLAAIVDEAPDLTEEQAQELRPLLLAPNVVTERGKSKGRRPPVSDAG